MAGVPLLYVLCMYYLHVNNTVEYYIASTERYSGVLRPKSEFIVQNYSRVPYLVLRMMNHSFTPVQFQTEFRVS